MKNHSTLTKTKIPIPTTMAAVERVIEPWSGYLISKGPTTSNPSLILVVVVRKPVRYTSTPARPVTSDVNILFGLLTNL